MTSTSEFDLSSQVRVPDSVHGVPAATEAVLRRMFDVHRATTDQISPVVATLVDELASFTLSGGKRVRPTFAWSGYRCAGGSPAADGARQALVVGAALELIQACALIHDDIIDRSDTRRGHPTVHRELEASHVAKTWAGDADHYGVSTAILLGDLALSWADDVIACRDLPVGVRARVQPLWAAMRTEVLAGQLLDVVGEASGDESVDAAFQVMRYKTAGYTVTRPLQLGAALAGGGESLSAVLGTVGDGLGIAFQLRDDLLGVFGDPARTGKPSGDDLVAGKRTALLALGLANADAQDRVAAAELRAMIGQPLTDDELDRARTILRQVGAERAVEEHIERLVTDSFDALDTAVVDSAARTELVSVATRIAGRAG